MPVASRNHQEEQIYCAEQINIPVTFPNILKCYAKAAVRTQPYDLLRWTAAYFRALANSELPPVKERLEYPPYVHPLGITPRFLKILLNQYCHDEDYGRTGVTSERTSRTMLVTLESLLVRWRGMALKDTSLYQILMTGRLLELPGDPRVCDLYRFLATACGLMGNVLRCDKDEKAVNFDKASERETRDNAEIFEDDSETEDRRDTTSQETSGGATIVETETTRISRAESPSENTMYDDKMRPELKVPEGKAEKLDGTAEVTRVQEEPSQRRDVEMHSRTEKVRPLAGETTPTTTISKLSPSSPQPRLDSSPSSPRPGTSSSSLAKSHVPVVKDVKTEEMATAGTTTLEKTVEQEEFHETDKILSTSSHQLSKQADGVHDENKVPNVPIENIPYDREAPITPRQVNVERARVRRIREKKIHKSPRTRTRETKKTGEKVVRDSFEYDDPTPNDVDDFTSSKKNSLRQENDEKILSKRDSAREETALNSEDYVGSEYNEIDGESVEYEDDDMANYEPIGLENILEGICECLETTEDTKNLASGEAVELTPPQPIDIVEDFIERMKIECPSETFDLRKVPGIGHSVSPETVTAVGLWLTECSRRQEGQVAPRNLRHFMCPNLDGKLTCNDYRMNFCQRDESIVYSITE